MRYYLLGNSGLRVSEACLGTLNEASRIDLGFPHEFLEGTKAVTYGGYYDEIHGKRRGAPLHWPAPGRPEAT
jgi:hypothetical protein